MQIIEFISQPWPWYVSGFAIALTMFLLVYEGKNFGMSSNLRTMCTIGGAGKFADFFRFDWKSQRWNLLVVIGSVIGGFIASQFLTPEQSLELNTQTVEALQELGFSEPKNSYVPQEIFAMENLMSFKGISILVIAGFLVGFGARYAGGCTSGHAISGLSNLQLPSLVAVVGFFIGGLIMTHFLLPVIF
ncbi:YeeE/YedE thiosulfate transporter family protein [Flammeovirgaceae bacterium SG7u.111]|nr:YeeE/YedE thiosulfate transporter family protein [Flammeovirgaceae bacterium SG7u.132]WPO33646.1 YeeE/YedE thiosulfate transporter family protein [Flammeovirgaceae bacterium SG7u.111]